MDGFFEDLRKALRVFAHRPLLVAGVIFSLALGIGANTAIFTLGKALLANPLRVPAADELVTVFTVDAHQQGGLLGGLLPVSYPNFEDLRDHARGLADLAAFQTLPVSLSLGEESEEATAQIVSADFFEILGVAAAHGRLLRSDEAEPPGAHPVAVIGHRLWTGRFAANPGVLGRPLRINGHRFTVVGVAPAGFRGPAQIPTPDLWVPMSMHREVLSGPFLQHFENRRALLFFTVGRLAPGASREQLGAGLGGLAARLEREHPEANRNRGLAVRPVAEVGLAAGIRQTFERAALLLAAVVVIVLLVACANAANLLLVRATERRSETAIRLSLGATRGRLLRRLALEGAALALAGGALALLVAVLLRRLLWTYRPPVLADAAPDLSLDVPGLVFTALLALGTGVLFTLAPAVLVSRTRLAAALGRRLSADDTAGRFRLRHAIVAVQVALCTAALAGAAIFFSGFRSAQRIDPGFDTDRLALVSFDLGTAGYEPQSAELFQRRLVESVEALPGIDSAALAANVPLTTFGGLQRSVTPEGGEARAQEEGLLVYSDVVSDEYFATLGIPPAAGRVFTVADRVDSAPVAVVNRTLARRLWPAGDAVDRLLRLHGEAVPRRVVGVVEDAQYLNLGEEPRPYLYLPLGQTPWLRTTLFVRSAADGPDRMLPLVAREVRKLDPALPLGDATTMPAVVAESLWAPRLGALLLGALGILALVLAVVGIYGVMSYSVGRRRREIGVRMALGADRGAILRLVLGHGMSVVLAGATVGLAAAFLGARSIRGLLYGADAGDPRLFIAIGLVLAAVALFANLLPARRATQLEPIEVLREQ